MWDVREREKRGHPEGLGPLPETGKRQEGQVRAKGRQEAGVGRGTWRHRVSGGSPTYTSGEVAGFLL